MVRKIDILRSTVRRIEAECIDQHGEWKWELLPEEVQDEYDVACLESSRIRQGNEPPQPFEQVMQELGMTAEELAQA